jgi:hypothetical protein
LYIVSVLENYPSRMTGKSEVLKTGFIEKIIRAGQIF